MASLRAPNEAEDTVHRIHLLRAAMRELFLGWTPEICLLLERFEVLRYGELRDRLRGIGSRTLAAKLAQLRQRGFISRALLDRIPPHVEYRLTDRGRRLISVMVPLLDFLGDSVPTGMEARSEGAAPGPSAGARGDVFAPFSRAGERELHPLP